MSGKKSRLLFGTAEKPAGTEPAEQFNRKEEKTVTGTEPYIVFETEEEFRAAVEAELEKRGSAAPESAKSVDGERKKLIEQWQKAASELKEIVPDFDFSSALKNEVFRNALASGKSVFAAYAEMTRVPKNPKRDELYQNARSPRRGTGEATINPAKLSSEDFKKYINNIKNQ